MADIINFNSAKKENIKDKVKFLNDILMPEHKSIIRHINDMLIYDKTILEDKSTATNYVININGGPLSTVKINVTKNKLKYNITLVDYENLKCGVETTITYNKQVSGEYEVTKKRKKVLEATKFVECKYTKAAFDATGKFIARITYLRDENSTTLLQENQLSEDKRLINIYGYDDKLNLVTMLKGYKREVGYVFYEGFTNNLRVPDDKALFALGIKNILTQKIKFIVRSARLTSLEVITVDDINVLNNREKTINAIKSIPPLEKDFKNAFESFEGLKKYKNEYDEDVIIVRLNDGNVYKYTRKNSTIFDVQAEKYKCFYENDFLNPNNIVSEVETLTYPLVPVEEVIITKNNKSSKQVTRKTFEEYEDDYLLLRRVKEEKDGAVAKGTVILESEWVLETNDSYKKQTFTKKNNYSQKYEEYDYLCNPEDDKVGFRFVTREYYNETLKEVFAFGKLNEDGRFRVLNSLYMRKNSPFDAVILKSEDAENMNPEKVLMDYGKVASIETQLAGIEYYEYNVDKDDDNEKIYVNANRLSKFLNDVEEIEERMLKDFKIIPKNFNGQITEEVRAEIEEEIRRIRDIVKSNG